MSGDLLLYRTYSICSRCMIRDRRGISWRDGEVREREGVVVLVCICPTHGRSETVYSSDAGFFRYAMSFTPSNPLPPMPPAPAAPREIEDLVGLGGPMGTIGAPPRANNLPLVAEIEVFGRDGLAAADQTRAEVARWLSLYPNDHGFVVKVLGRTCLDMPGLNQRCAEIHGQIGGRAMMLELPFDRWESFVGLEGSALLLPKVFPSVLMYLHSGQERQDVENLARAVDALATIRGIGVALHLVIDRPFPDLSPMMDFIVSRRGLVRYVVFSTSRRPAEIMAGLDGGATVDPMEVLGVIEHGSRSIPVPLSRFDFMPMSAGMVLEPFLPHLGLGRLSVRPSSWCGFATCLISSEKFRSVPVTRLLDVPKLYQELLPMHASLVKDGKPLAKLDFIDGFKFKRIVKNCTRPGVQLPDVLSYLSDKKKEGIADETIHNLQFVVFHNTMDLAAIDALRRCRCVVQTVSAKTANGFSAACTGCF